jgi:DNA (cytosine-5)-methyltransferase 1
MGSPGEIIVRPSVRSAAILRSRKAKPPYRTLELFCGGGTLSQALTPDFKLVAGVEKEPHFADCWEKSHHGATLIQGDIRMISTSELPECDILIAGLPCSDHSRLGRARKGRGDAAEIEGSVGDLFLHVASIVQSHMPLACVFEQVPGFESSMAGQLLRSHLDRLGYSVTETILDTSEQWGEPFTRRRWVAVATLGTPMAIRVPIIPFSGRAGDYLDAPNASLDRSDAERIAGTIACLRRRSDAFQRRGLHGFPFSTVTAGSSRVPTIVKNYHKKSTGPFVETPWGPRLLRQGEIERLHGAVAHTYHYATAVEVLGQGVLPRVFRTIFEQLAEHLAGARTDSSVCVSDPDQRTFAFE